MQVRCAGSPYIYGGATHSVASPWYGNNAALCFSTRPARQCATEHLCRTLQYGTPPCIMRRTLYAMLGGMASILSDLQGAEGHTWQLQSCAPMRHNQPTAHA